MMNNIASKAFETIKKYNMLCKGDRVVVGVSGGADSMLLLHFLFENRQRLGITVCAAHVEHGIRGEESKSDARFVGEYCKKNGIELFTESINAPGEAEKCKMGVEEYSRKVRYEFFSSLSCDKIATAHNMSDNVETLIFRLARKTGLKGACGIPPVRGRIIRPFIEISSDEIRNYCRQNDIAFVADSTNFKNIYARNLIRLDILPLLKKINSDYESNISSFIGDACEDYDFIKNESKKAYDTCVSDGRIDLKRLNTCHAAVKKRIIKEYFYKNGITLDRIHLESVLALCKKSGKTQLKDNYYTVSSGGYLRLASFCPTNSSEKSAEIVKFEAQILNNNEFNARNVDFYCDCDKIIGKVSTRSRRAGDKICPANRGVTKTLKKLFNESSVDVEKRSFNLVVEDECGIIGVVGICADERVKPDLSTKRYYTLKILAED